MKFKYTGQNRQAQWVSGEVEAEDEMEAKLRLRSMQIRATDVKKVAKPMFGGDGKKRFNLSKPIDLKGLIVFTRQFSSLIDSGVPVVQCLDILCQQEKRPAFKKVLAKIKEDIEGGSGLANALGQHPSVFSDLFVRICEAGEISGTLDLALRRLANQLERLGRIRAKVIGAMTYPCITVVVAIFVLIFLLVKVIPGISKLYASNAATLPDLTLFVLAMSAWVQAKFLYLIGGIGAFFLSIPVLYSLPGFRKYWDPFVLKTPGFGNLIKKSSIGRFTRTMSTLVSSGVPLLSGFEICMKLISNLAIKNVILSAKNSVTEGKSIAQGLSAKNIFPPMVLHMVAIGEMTGKLDELLGKVADIYDDEIDDAVDTITGLIQPILIVVVGAMVAFLLLAMYMPIFQLADKLTGSLAWPWFRA